MRYLKNKPLQLSVREMPLSERPREKQQAKGSAALSDLELMMVLLSSGTHVRRVNDIAMDLLELLDRKPDASLEEIASIKGIGSAKAATVAACLEIGRRRVQEKRPVISSPKDIFDEVRHYAERPQEQFLVLAANGAHEIINIFTASVGLVNRTLVHPREVFADPLMRRATAIAIAHNHPSGVLEPSEEDIRVTERLIKAGEILGIKVIDHLVFSRSNYFSFIEHGLI